ncbi:MAG: M81 family metallopeptidase, partial [Chloroflexi bacterium]|nr:M81 family metallopeptidase [Chloroflexota bacterium]
MRIALGGMTHEANSFCPRAATLADFDAGELLRGDALLTGWPAAGTEQAGAAEVLLNTPGCTLIPTLLARALSARHIERTAWAVLRDELLARLAKALPLDGVLLVLHGAMMAEGEPDATGELLDAVRQRVGASVPVVATLDLHANVTRRMHAAATALIGYQTAPHVDMRAAGRKAATLLLAVLKGAVTPASALVRLPMLVPAELITHTEGPLSEVIAAVHALEQRGEIIHGGVYPVQPWLDTPDVASSIVVLTDGEPTRAAACAEQLAAMLWERRAQFVPPLVPPAEAVRRALARPSGCVILCDSADATSSGSTGDGTALLAELLRAAPDEQQAALANVVDPAVVAQAIAAGVGATLETTVGGRLAPQYAQPVAVRARVKLISDGAFAFQGPGMRGVVHQMGRTAMLWQGGLHLVVMERPVSQWDPQLYRS